MTKSKKTKRALLSSVLSLIVCFSMLLGTTFAWFTDTVTISGNKIQSGTLDIKLSQMTDSGWKDISNSTEPLFNYDKWEPGYTEVQVLKIENAGTLALRWAANIAPLNADNVSELADAIDVYVSTSAQNLPTDFKNVQGTYELVGTLRYFITNFEKNTVGKLYPAGTAGEESEAYLGIALHMREEAGNEYQGLSLGSDFDIRIYATQLEYEEDSFDNTYDEDATYPTDYKVTSTASVNVTTDENDKVTSAIVNEALTIKASETSKAVSNVTVQVPVKVAVETDAVTTDDDDKSTVDLTVLVTEKEEDETGLVISDDKDALALDIDVVGVAETNKVPITVTLTVPTGLTGVTVYHKGDQMNPLSETNTDAGYSYVAETGVLTIKTATFSPFTIVHDAYPVVTTEAELVRAIAEGGIIKVADGLEIKNVITINTGVTLDLQGKLDASACASRPFEMANGASLTINAGNNTVTCGAYGLVNVPANVSATVTLNDGNYVANTKNGSFIKLREGGKESDVVTLNLNNVNYTDNSADGFLLNVYKFAGETKVTVNGGTYKANAGFHLGDNSTVKNATIAVAAVAFEVYGSATLDGCTITSDPSSTVGTAPGAAVAVSNGGVATVNNCNVSSKLYAYDVYSTGGTINVTGGSYEGTINTDHANGLITIDGVAVVNSAASLKHALQVSDNVKLIADIETADQIIVNGDVDVTLDLNNHTLKSTYTDTKTQAIRIDGNAFLTIKNGTVEAPNTYIMGVFGNGKVDAEKCIFNGKYCFGMNGGLTNADSVANFTDCEFHITSGYNAAYISAKGKYTFTNCELEGGAAMLIRSGDVVLDGCTLIANGYMGEGEKQTDFYVNADVEENTILKDGMAYWNRDKSELSTGDCVVIIDRSGSGYELKSVEIKNCTFRVVNEIKSDEYTGPTGYAVRYFAKSASDVPTIKPVLENNVGVDGNAIVTNDEVGGTYSFYYAE